MDSKGDKATDSSGENKHKIKSVTDGERLQWLWQFWPRL